MKKIAYIVLLILPLLAGCNKFKQFDEFFVAFDPIASDPTTVNCESSAESTYVIHLTSTTPAKPIIITYSIIPGDGLAEGIDYSLPSKSNTIEFFPGIFDKSIKVKWLKHQIDASKKNTLTIRLEKSSSSDICLGQPGPDEINRSITITKY